MLNTFRRKVLVRYCQAPLQDAGTGGGPAGEDQLRWTGLEDMGLARGGRCPGIPEEARHVGTEPTDPGRIGVLERPSTRPTAEARPLGGPDKPPMFERVADGLLPSSNTVFALRQASS